VANVLGADRVEGGVVSGLAGGAGGARRPPLPAEAPPSLRRSGRGESGRLLLLTTARLFLPPLQLSVGPSAAQR